ncbi:NERD domain-containing protein [Clostridiaceae bacterium UIB06]|uniref:NERD domain-containing protein n=1 Tax=Clostridium thailandense TaxID=2794346 RepID=A0A949U027_9CLOT|nr:NERD domain-containing protein [Clostridium thailandense]MBV7273764.1 NERD domain-containing protein [Clostridium thailandense]MCH5137456.1 NERD domain-containing protein [Clostridiaceae bacterium UIB06]
MGLFKGLLDTFINKTSSLQKNMELISHPVFIKEFCKENVQIEDLQNIMITLDDEEKKERISRDITYLKQGMFGEQNVFFELKNANIPFLCLHDIRLEYEGLSAQIDFLILTKQYICILETKQLQGNIDVNKEGNFIRVYTDKLGKTTRSGMYSPVEQNRKHVNLVKKILKEKFNIDKMPVKSLIVMANPKTIIRKSYAPEEIQEQIIRAENLESYLSKWIDEIDYNLKEDEVFNIANYLKESHKPITFDYNAKYKLDEKTSNFNSNKSKMEKYEKQKSHKIVKDEEVLMKCKEIQSDDVNTLREQLKKFRLETSKRENIRAYFVFNNDEMESLIEKRPQSEKELLKVRGFGEKKVEKYGKEILNILKN